MRKVGIFGGTFSPVHNGHLMLAERAYSDLGLDEVLIIPTGVSHFKDNSVIDKLTRYEMTKIAVADNDHINVSRIEIDRPGNSYTYETLLALKEVNPDVSYYLIIGADSLMQLEDWYKPDVIMANAVIVVAARDDVGINELQVKADDLKDRFGADVRILTFPLIELSSTDIRRRVKEGLSIRYMVPDSVIKYIDENNLYR